MRIETVVVTPFQQNARVISAGEQCVILDPGGEVGRILKVVGDREVCGIILTHYHIDHCAGVAALLEQLGKVTIYGGEERIAYQAAFSASRQKSIITVHRPTYCSVRGAV